MCSNHQPNSTTFKNATVTKMAIKQRSAFNETSTKPVTCIRAARKKRSPTIREGMAVENFIESGSASAPVIMAHDPGLASKRTSHHNVNKNEKAPLKEYPMRYHKKRILRGSTKRESGKALIDMDQETKAGPIEQAALADDR